MARIAPRQNDTEDAAPRGTVLLPPSAAPLPAASPVVDPSLPDVGPARPKPPTSHGTTPMPNLPNYEMLGELGRGGMGIVFKARQKALNRLVAVKMVRSFVFADKDALDRLLVEAASIAALDHPHVVQIHEVGHHDGCPFLTLELLDGGGLDRRLDGTPWLPRQAAELVADVADGVAEAHRNRIVHRDLKPGNILFTSAGEAKVTDFGLAKSLVGCQSTTLDGTIMGTPSYMAPEQAEGRMAAIGPAADVYALAAILYELVVGRPPHRGATAVETLQLVRSTEPVPPRRLQPRLPVDLETIILKGLRRDPASRYPAADELAADLRRFLANEPILARPIGPLGKAVKWVKRRPVVAGLLAAVALSVAVGFTATLTAYGQAVANAAAARAAEADARQQTRVAEQAIELAGRASYRQAIVIADLMSRDNERTTARKELDALPESQQRGWEWSHLRRVRFGDPFPRWKLPDDFVAPNIDLHAIEFLSDGDLLAPAGGAFDVGVGADRPRGGLVVVGLSGRAARFYTRRCGPPADPRGQADAGLNSLAPVAGGDGAAWATGTHAGPILLWKLEKSDPVAVLPHPVPVRTLRSSPNGKLLAVGRRPHSADAGSFEVRDLAGKAVVEIATDPDRGWFQDGFFLDDHTVLIVWRNRMELFSLDSPAKRRTFPFQLVGGSPVALRQDRAMLAVANGPTVSLFDVRALRDLPDGAAPTARHQWVAHDKPVTLLAFSPDGLFMATTANRDRRLRVFPVGRSSPLREYRSGNETTAMAFSPDGHALMAFDSELRRWELAESPDVRRLPPEPKELAHVFCDLAFVGDQGDMATLAIGKVRFVDGRTGQLTKQTAVAFFPRVKWPRHDLILRPDGGLAVGPAADDPRVLRTIELPSGRIEADRAGAVGPIESVAVSADGSRVAAVAARGPGDQFEVLVWERGRRDPLVRVPIVMFPLAVAFDAKAERIAVGVRHPERPAGTAGLLVLDANTGATIHNEVAPEVGLVSGLAFSPDGRWLAAANGVGAASLFDTADWRRRDFPVRSAPTRAVAFSPDSRRLATADYDGNVWVADTETAIDLLNLACPVPRERDIGYTLRVAFDAAGRRIAANDFQCHVNVWDDRLEHPTPDDLVRRAAAFDIDLLGSGATDLPLTPEQRRLLLGRLREAPLPPGPPRWHRGLEMARFGRWGEARADLDGAAIPIGNRVAIALAVQAKDDAAVKRHLAAANAERGMWVNAVLALMYRPDAVDDAVATEFRAAIPKERKRQSYAQFLHLALLDRRAGKRDLAIQQLRDLIAHPHTGPLERGLFQAVLARTLEASGDGEAAAQFAAARRVHAEILAKLRPARATHQPVVNVEYFVELCAVLGAPLE